MHFLSFKSAANLLQIFEIYKDLTVKIESNPQNHTPFSSLSPFQLVPFLYSLFLFSSQKGNNLCVGDFSEEIQTVGGEAVGLLRDIGMRRMSHHHKSFRDCGLEVVIYEHTATALL